jgi:hypothetical protein
VILFLFFFSGYLGFDFIKQEIESLKQIPVGYFDVSHATPSEVNIRFRVEFPTRLFVQGDMQICHMVLHMIQSFQLSVDVLFSALTWCISVGSFDFDRHRILL